MHHTILPATTPIGRMQTISALPAGSYCLEHFPTAWGHRVSENASLTKLLERVPMFRAAGRTEHAPEYRGDMDRLSGSCLCRNTTLCLVNSKPDTMRPKKIAMPANNLSVLFRRR